LTNACAISAPINGTVSGNTISATLTEGGQAVSLTGTVASNGKSASGTYTSPTGGCTNGDSGTWSGSDPSISGLFVGTINPADRIPIRVSLNLKADEGNVSGSISLANSACFGSLEIQGKAAGTTMEIRGTGPSGIVNLQGALDASRTTLAVESQVGGDCKGESGAGMLTRVP
jgi:hypothetical protein